jgi:GNAT superfamily N-acetyltransferase
MKERILTKQERKKHWYVFIMGTSIDRRRQGLGGVLLENMKERARADERPLWLEATTELSLALYLKHGFQNHGEVILGKGKVGRDGLPKKDGEGIVIWSMSWRP